MPDRNRIQQPPMGPYLLGEAPARIRKGQMDTTRLGWTVAELLKLVDPKEMDAVKYTPPIPGAVDPNWSYKAVPSADLEKMKSRNLMEWFTKYFGS